MTTTTTTNIDQVVGLWNHAKPSAKMILDSMSPDGSRLVTVQVDMHRFVLPEFNTHRWSRNSASSRAIPAELQLERYTNEPWYPLVWAAERPGMQGGEELTGADLDDAQKLFDDVHYWTKTLVSTYLIRHPAKGTRLHKSLINRLLEPLQKHVVVFSSTEQQLINFFDQRCNPAAQPEMRIAAEEIMAVVKASTPTQLKYGEWHKPYLTDSDRQLQEDDQLMISAARCAGVSYMTQEREDRDPAHDVEIFGKLVSARPMHASPLEHVATPMMPSLDVHSQMGNFVGWHQLRHSRFDLQARFAKVD